MAVSAQTVYTGDAANIPIVARVSLADYRGNVVLDTLVRPTHEVTNYRTAETGLVSAHLANAPMFREVQHRVSALIRDKIIVGHNLWQFLSVLCISHPTINTRDVAAFVPFRRGLGHGGVTPALHFLVHSLMGRSIGLGYEHPLENARAALDLYRSAQHPWENAIDSGSWPCILPPVGYAEYFL
ncbi:ribonuclease H-like domain-containing protein [Russula vinacea]|nr:ribonuclease H-like domain-containing protein [Russula vinacea]